ncbi:hypothetical protein [Salinimicrobium sp. GXAS 041]|uniref:hypothetical protein n=1 Tax=Salinimicrobium sp. GXAS 041 TaxID=3400806 RepID=UPI003C73365D
MTKIYFSLLCLLFASGVFAQQTDYYEEPTARETAQNELSANAFNVLVFGALDLGYERILSDHNSISVDLFTKLLNKNEGEDFDLSEAYAKDFSLTTRFKFFFNEDYSAWGFYAEGFAMLSSGENKKKVELTDTEGETYTEERYLDYTDFAIGVGAGYKYAAKQGFVIDLSFGLGRNLFHKDSPDLVILPAVNVGYRF